MRRHARMIVAHPPGLAAGRRQQQRLAEQRRGHLARGDIDQRALAGRTRRCSAAITATAAFMPTV